MTHVQLTKSEGGDPKLLVDGFDMTNAVVRDGFSISQLSNGFQVTLTLTPSASIDIDLPDCLVKIIRRVDALAAAGQVDVEQADEVAATAMDQFGLSEESK